MIKFLYFALIQAVISFLYCLITHYFYKVVNETREMLIPLLEHIANNYNCIQKTFPAQIF